MKFKVVSTPEGSYYADEMRRQQQFDDNLAEVIWTVDGYPVVGEAAVGSTGEYYGAFAKVYTDIARVSNDPEVEPPSYAMFEAALNNGYIAIQSLDRGLLN